MDWIPLDIVTPPAERDAVCLALFSRRVHRPPAAAEGREQDCDLY